MADFTAVRELMVTRQIEARGITDPAILAAMRAIPREEFVPAHLADRAYDDGALPIESGQTISQPYVVAWMIEAAKIGSGDHVLEVGAGSGYAAAVIGQIAGSVVAIERHPLLAGLAAERIERLEYTNVRIIEGDGTLGCPDEAPFDAILTAAAAREVPEALIDQLKPGGRLVIPVGGRLWSQALVRLTKQADDTIVRDRLGDVRFVPLIAERG